MKTEYLIALLRFAGVLHLGLLCAGLVMTRVVSFHAHLRALPGFLRQLFCVYLLFIGFMLASFGLISFVCAPQLVLGTPLARALCLFLIGFWSLRMIAAAFVFDVKPYLTSWFYRTGYYATNLVFAYLLAVYAVVFLKAGR